jgi:hypothetical protein
MGEYIKYQGTEIKIGTCEDMYYATYQKYNLALERGQLIKSDNSSNPEEYAKPDSGIRFRFPFPDEDHFQLGDIGKNAFDRGVTILISGDLDDTLAVVNGVPQTLELRQQKLVHKESDGRLALVPVLHNPLTKETFRIEDEAVVKKLLKEITENHINNGVFPETRDFYKQIAARLSEGYYIASPAEKTIQRREVKPRLYRRKGKGL